MKTYDAVLFDLDGTLLNTIGDLAAAVNVAEESFGYPKHSVAEIQSMVGNGIRKLLARAIPDGEDNPNLDAVLAKFVEYYTAHVAVKTDYYPGIRQLVETLSAKGIKMAIVSNKFQNGSEILRERFFADTIPVVYGDHPSRERKPATDAPFGAMKELGVAPERTLYVGDSQVDAQTAENAGLDYVLVDWGFCPRADLEKWNSIAIISEPSALLDFFLDR